MFSRRGISKQHISFSVIDTISTANGVNQVLYTVELQWHEHFWDCKNMFETGVVRANEC